MVESMERTLRIAAMFGEGLLTLAWAAFLAVMVLCPVGTVALVYHLRHMSLFG